MMESYRYKFDAIAYRNKWHLLDGYLYKGKTNTVITEVVFDIFGMPYGVTRSQSVAVYQTLFVTYFAGHEKGIDVVYEIDARTY